MILRNVDIYLPSYMMSHSKRQHCYSHHSQNTQSQKVRCFVALIKSFATEILFLWLYTTILTQAVVTEWSAVCYLNEVVFQWTLNPSKGKWWKEYFSAWFSFLQLMCGNWILNDPVHVGYVMESGAEHVVIPVLQFSLINIFHHCSILIFHSSTTVVYKLSNWEPR